MTIRWRWRKEIDHDHTCETTAAKEIEALRTRGVFVTHDEWWDQVGSALRPRVGEDAHEHVKRVTVICWVTARAAIYEAEAAQLTAPLRAQVEQYREGAERYRSAIEWALGTRGEFRVQGTMDGAYWWRGELAEKARLSWNGTQWIDKARKA